METKQMQYNIATKLYKINMGEGAPDDGVTDTASNKLGKCDRGRHQTWTILKTV